MPIEGSHKPYDAPRKAFHNGISYSELHGHQDGDGLTTGIFVVEGGSDTAVVDPFGTVGIVTKGVLVIVDSGAPNDQHVFKEGQTFHIKKGSTFKWGANSNGTAFYAIAKPIGQEYAQNLKKPVF